MIDPSDIEQTICDILTERGRTLELTPDLLLGSHGIGLDSIAMVEVLLECEMRLGVTIASDLLGGEALTVGRLVESIRSCERKRAVE